MAQKLLRAHRQRLESIATFLGNGALVPGQINLATFMATHRTDEERLPVGCILGHYARAGVSEAISLVPINFLSQLKSPVMAPELLDQYPVAKWQHWTLRYLTGSTEAYGESAACLFLRMGGWDVNRLFYPAGASYEIRPPIESLVFRLGTMVRTL